MEIPKAIEILELAIPDPEAVTALEMIDAMQLGIEAMKAIIDVRANNYYTPIPLLPGETTE